MTVEVIHTDDSKKILIRVIEGELPEPGIYTVFFESTKPDPIPEFNQ